MSSTTVMLAFLTATATGFIITRIYWFVKQRINARNHKLFWEMLEDEEDNWD